MSRGCDRTIGPKTATKRYGGASARCSALNQLDRPSNSSVFTLPPTTISTFNATWSLDRPFGSSGQKQPRNGAVQPQRHDPRHNQTTITADAAQLDKAAWAGTGPPLSGWPSPLDRDQFSAMIGLRKTPSPPSISTSTTSPGFIHSGGLRANPTPSGVPVEMTSPATSASSRSNRRSGSGYRRSDRQSRCAAFPCRLTASPDQAGGVRNLVRGNDPRPKAAGRVEVLAGSDRMLELNVSDRAVVETGVAKDMAQRV